MRKLTEQEFQDKIKEIHGNKYKTLEPYINSRTKILVKCNICGCVWKTATLTKNSIRGCPECAKEKARIVNKHPNAASKFLKKLNKIHNGNIDLLGVYIDVYTKIRFKCNVCRNIWYSKPYNLLRKHGCPKCGHIEKGKKHCLSNEEFIDRVFEIHNNNVSVLTQYKGGNKKLHVRCNKCLNEWQTLGRYLLLGRGCPECNISKGEEKVKYILDEFKINYKREFCFNDLKSPDSGKLRFDFGVFDSIGNVWFLMEYDGEQHFGPCDYFGGLKRFRKQKRNDDLKNKYCVKNNIPLLRIHNKDYNNIKKIIGNFINV